MRRALARLIGYSVHSHEWNARHWALTMREALEWAACYPASDFLFITQRGRFVAVRGQ